MNVVPACVCSLHVSLVPVEERRGTLDPRNWRQVLVSCCVSAGNEPGPPEEQLVLLITELSIQPQEQKFKDNIL